MSPDKVQDEVALSAAAALHVLYLVDSRQQTYVFGRWAHSTIGPRRSATSVPHLDHVKCLLAEVASAHARSGACRAVARAHPEGSSCVCDASPQSCHGVKDGTSSSSCTWRFRTLPSRRVIHWSTLAMRVPKPCFSGVRAASEAQQH